MKNLLILMLLFITRLSYADGLDEMRIYINHKLVAASYEGGSQLLELEISEGDTLTFELSTDWGGEYGGSLSIFDHISSEQLIELSPRTKDNGIFEQIISPQLMGSELLFVYNFTGKEQRKWKFARIVFKRK